MPHFTAIALDRLLEPGASKSVDMPVPSNKYPVPKPKPKPKTSPPELKRPLPNSNLERRNSTSVKERKCNRPQISPGLYATPASTPLPDSPTSFHPSPYIINHKRRGPRLLKSFSEEDLASRKKELEKVEVNGNVNNGENEVVDLSNGHSVTFFTPGSVEGEFVNDVNGYPGKEDAVNGVRDCPIEVGCVNGSHGGEIGSSSVQLGNSNTRKDLAMAKDVLKPIEQNEERNGDSDDFFDPRDSMSYTSNTDAEDTAAVESSMKLAASVPVGEFYDAWEGTWVFVSCIILPDCFTLVDHVVVRKVIAACSSFCYLLASYSLASCFESATFKKYLIACCSYDAGESLLLLHFLYVVLGPFFCIAFIILLVISSLVWHTFIANHIFCF